MTLRRVVKSPIVALAAVLLMQAAGASAAAFVHRYGTPNQPRGSSASRR